MLSPRFLAAITLAAIVPLSASAVTLFPAQGAQNVCPDTPLRITFEAPPSLGETGKIEVAETATKTVVATVEVTRSLATQVIGGVDRFNYYPVMITGNEATIVLPNQTLRYHQTYTVVVGPSVFSLATEAQAKNDTPLSWTFTTKEAPPKTPAAKLTIAADGSGDFCTIQGAIDSIPDGNTTPVTLFLRKGTYHELICIKNKHALTLLGEDRKQSVIAYANNAKLNPTGSPYRRGVLLTLQTNNFTLANLTIHNTTPRGGTQAETIIFKGNAKTAHAIVTDVDLVSFQDTLQINGQGYLKNCYIEGDVDFMWGTGPCFFENCLCRSTRPGAYYTQIRNPETNHGFVYHHCTFDGTKGVTGSLLSRIEPLRFPHSEVILVDCELGPSVGAAGWLVQGEGPTSDLHFWEYRSRNTENRPADTSKRHPASRQLKEPEDAKTILNYSDPTFVLGGDWNPAKAPIFLR